MIYTQGEIKDLGRRMLRALGKSDMAYLGEDVLKYMYSTSSVLLVAKAFGRAGYHAAVSFRKGESRAYAFIVSRHPLCNESKSKYLTIKTY